MAKLNIRRSVEFVGCLYHNIYFFYYNISLYLLFNKSFALQIVCSNSYCFIDCKS